MGSPSNLEVRPSQNSGYNSRSPAGLLLCLRQQWPGEDVSAGRARDGCVSYDASLDEAGSKTVSAHRYEQENFIRNGKKTGGGLG